MKVTNNSAHVEAIGAVKLRPGMNDVPDAMWAKNACDKSGKLTKVVTRKLAENGGPLKVESGSLDLSKMSEHDAMKAVGDVLDSALLARMLDGEKRGSVRKAIETQQAKMKAPKSE